LYKSFQTFIMTAVDPKIGNIFLTECFSRRASCQARAINI
jgi:hypothetical protein